MTESSAAKLRRLWLNIHLWLGLTLAVLLIPISVSGGLLVFHDDLDALLNPRRYAVTGAAVAQPPSVYLAKAAEAVAADPAQLKATGLRYPEPGRPVRVTARAQTVTPGERPRFVTMFLDPPTAAVLDVMEFGSSLFGFLHVFHENLMLGRYNGRQIVGWAGVAMLIVSLTGIWLWWPRNGNSWRGILRGLRWTRSPRFSFNLHTMLGFWIALPLAAVSLTGIYLSFPQTARGLMASIAPMSERGPRGGFNARIAEHPALTPDAALAIALNAEPGATPSALSLPTQARGKAAPVWRVQLERGGEPVTVMINDRSGKASPAAARKSGDRAAAWIRWIHEGSHSGPVWTFIVFLTSVFPTVFAVTGIIMWLRKRADRRRRDALRQNTQLRPAE